MFLMIDYTTAEGAFQYVPEPGDPTHRWAKMSAADLLLMNSPVTLPEDRESIALPRMFGCSGIFTRSTVDAPSAYTISSRDDYYASGTLEGPDGNNSTMHITARHVGRITAAAVRFLGREPRILMQAIITPNTEA